jgi:ethanolamine ammonia-lyase large subunit
MLIESGSLPVIVFGINMAFVSNRVINALKGVFPKYSIDATGCVFTKCLKGITAINARVSKWLL